MKNRSHAVLHEHVVNRQDHGPRVNPHHITSNPTLILVDATQAVTPEW
jgi:hypothetical protein